MKAVSFCDFALDIPKQTLYRHRFDNHCRICNKDITDQAYYCNQHNLYRRMLNQQMERWIELEERLIQGDNVEEVVVWP